jgi:hypothetical protein
VRRDVFGAAGAEGQCAPRLPSGASVRPLNFTVRRSRMARSPSVAVALVAAALLVATSSVWAATVRIRILFVGNSLTYYNAMP